MLQCLIMQTPIQSEPEGPFRIYSAKSLGAAVRHYRRTAGISQMELAAQTGIHRTYLSLLENGAETEQLKRLLRILKELGVRMSLDKAEW